MSSWIPKTWGFWVLVLQAKEIQSTRINYTTVTKLPVSDRSMSTLKKNRKTTLMQLLLKDLCKKLWRELQYTLENLLTIYQSPCTSMVCVFYYQILYTANTEHVQIEIVIQDSRVSSPEEWASKHLLCTKFICGRWLCIIITTILLCFPLLSSVSTAWCEEERAWKNDNWSSLQIPLGLCLSVSLCVCLVCLSHVDAGYGFFVLWCCRRV